MSVFVEFIIELLDNNDDDDEINSKIYDNILFHHLVMIHYRMLQHISYFEKLQEKDISMTYKYIIYFEYLIKLFKHKYWFN